MSQRLQANSAGADRAAGDGDGAAEQHAARPASAREAAADGSSSSIYPSSHSFHFLCSWRVMGHTGCDAGHSEEDVPWRGGTRVGPMQAHSEKVFHSIHLVQKS